MPTIEEYQRKLNETNLYLTILNDQIKIIDDKIFNSGIEKDEQQLVDIKVKTLTLIDSIKHTILLLELTKVSDYQFAFQSSRTKSKHFSSQILGHFKNENKQNAIVNRRASHHYKQFVVKFKRDQ